MAEVTHGERTLRDALAATTNSNRPFTPKPFYSAKGDFLTVFLADDAAYEERVDDILTVSRSMDTDDIVGCKIKGVSLLAEHVANVIKVVDGEFHVYLLLLNALGANAEHKEHYYDLSRRVGNLTLPTSMIKQMVSHIHADAA